MLTVSATLITSLGKDFDYLLIFKATPVKLLLKIALKEVKVVYIHENR